MFDMYTLINVYFQRNINLLILFISIGSIPVKQEKAPTAPP